MAGWKLWTVGEVVGQADFQSFLQNQVLFVFDDAAARDAAIGTADRVEGMFAYLKDSGGLEFFDGVQWGPFAAGAKGGGTDQIFYENGQSVTANYEITSGFNAMTAGPVEIQAGVTVEVPAGSVWTVV